MHNNIDNAKESCYINTVNCIICKKMEGGAVMPNLERLKGKLLENGKTYEDCANEIGVSTTTFSDKMNGKRKFYVEEANGLSDFISLSFEERKEIFLD